MPSRLNLIPILRDNQACPTDKGYGAAILRVRQFAAPEEKGTQPGMDAGREATWSQCVSARYSADARVYRELWAPLLLPFGEELLDALPLSEVSRVVDMGAGSGALIPGIRRRAPEALVVAVDRAPGMISLVAPVVPRLVMDAAHAGIASAAIDAVILAFILFHTSDPRRVLVEARRLLRTGGMIGTSTWDGDPDFPAQQIWIEELDAHGAVPAPAEMMSNHEPVSTTARMRRLLENSGFGSVRTWTRCFGHAYTLDEFLNVRTNLGWSKRRVESMDSETRESFLRSVRRRLERLSPIDFVDDAIVIFATAVAA